MNSAFDHHAGKQAGRIARCAALACALVVGGGSALAQQHGDRHDDRRDDQPAPAQRTERFRLPPQQGGDGRQGDARGYEDARRMQQEPSEPQRDGGRNGNRNGSRMTPDERRDLRRQINEAGMDLYPQRRHDR